MKKLQSVVDYQRFSESKIFNRGKTLWLLSKIAFDCGLDLTAVIVRLQVQ